MGTIFLDMFMYGQLGMHCWVNIIIVTRLWLKFFCQKTIFLKIYIWTFTNIIFISMYIQGQLAIDFTVSFPFTLHTRWRWNHNNLLSLYAYILWKRNNVNKQAMQCSAKLYKYCLFHSNISVCNFSLYLLTIKWYIDELLRTNRSDK